MRRSVQLRRYINLASALALAGVSACGGEPEQTGDLAAADSVHQGHWSYEGESGPAHWAALSPDYATCSSGQRQSPVMIPATAALDPNTIEFSYRAGPVRIENNGHTINVVPDSGSTIRVDDATYTLQQLHFHALSEHAVGDAHQPMEVHLVHRDPSGRLAVVGVLLREGRENAAYAPILLNPPRVAGTHNLLSDVAVNPADLLPADHGHWRYEGSLTTPPCAEDVTWLVMRDAVELSAQQIAAFTAIYPQNNRPVQPLGTRAFSSGNP